MIKSFEAISAILTKAVAFADERGMKHQELLESRLASDMRPFVLLPHRHPHLIIPFTFDTSTA